MRECVHFEAPPSCDFDPTAESHSERGFQCDESHPSKAAKTLQTIFMRGARVGMAVAKGAACLEWRIQKQPTTNEHTQNDHPSRSRLRADEFTPSSNRVSEMGCLLSRSWLGSGCRIFVKVGIANDRFRAPRAGGVMARLGSLLELRQQFRNELSFDVREAALDAVVLEAEALVV